MKNKLFLIGLILIFLLSGCSSSRESSAPGFSGDFYNQDIAVDMETLESMPSDGSSSSSIEGQKLIKQGSISLDVDDTKEKYAQIQELIKAYNGYIFSMNESNYENQSYMNITIKVDSKEFENLFEQLKTLGNLRSSNINTQDVTRDYIDTKARLDTLRIQEQTLQNILVRAETVEDLLKIETELQRVRQQIEASQGQLNYLENAIDFSIINLSLTSRRPPSAISQRDSIIDRLLFSLKDGIGFWTNFIISAAGFILWMLPVILIFIIIFKPLKKGITRIFNKKSGKDN